MRKVYHATPKEIALAKKLKVSQQRVRRLKNKLAELIGYYN